MAETGCLHNHKYSNLKIKNKLNTNNIKINKTYTTGNSDDTSIQQGDKTFLIPKVMETNVGFNSYVDLTTTKSYFKSPQTQGENWTYNDYLSDSDERGGVSDANGTADHVLNPTQNRRFSVIDFYAKFSNIFSVNYSKWRSDTTGNEEQILSLGAMQSSVVHVDGTAGNNFLSQAANYRFHFIKWPKGTIIKDLVLIPNKDIGTKGVTYDTDANVKLKQQLQKQLIVNLFVTKKDNSSNDIYDATTINSTETLRTDTTRPQLGLIKDDGIYMRSNRDTLEFTENAYNDANYQTGNPGDSSKGGYSYLIRELPIIASPDDGSDDIIWRKYTPISIIRDIGLPIEIMHSGGGYKHQHSTASTSNNLKHGNANVVQDIYDGTNELKISRKDDEIDIDSSKYNWNVNGELFSYSSIYRNLAPIMGSHFTDYYFSTDANRRLSWDRGILPYIQDGRRTRYVNGNMQASNYMDLNTTNREVWNGGMFINSSDEDLYLALTIGHICDPNSVADETVAVGEGVGSVKKFAATEGAYKAYPKGDIRNITTDGSGDPVFSTDAILEADGVKFKAIFTFKQLNT